MRLFYGVIVLLMFVGCDLLSDSESVSNSETQSTTGSSSLNFEDSSALSSMQVDSSTLSSAAVSSSSSNETSSIITQNSSSTLSSVTGLISSSSVVENTPITGTLEGSWRSFFNYDDSTKGDVYTITIGPDSDAEYFHNNFITGKREVFLGDAVMGSKPFGGSYATVDDSIISFYQVYMWTSSDGEFGIYDIPRAMQYSFHESGTELLARFGYGFSKSEDLENTWELETFYTTNDGKDEYSVKEIIISPDGSTMKLNTWYYWAGDKPNNSEVSALEDFGAFKQYTDSQGDKYRIYTTSDTLYMIHDKQLLLYSENSLSEIN